MFKSLNDFEIFQGKAHSEKYNSSNWISKYLVKNFLKTILKTCNQAGNLDVFEVGSGEGHVAGMLAQSGFRVKGCDISLSSIEVSRTEAVRNNLEIHFEEKSIYDINPNIDSCDTVICCEVLEHLTDPEIALTNLINITKKDLIVSVPNEPIWHLLNMVRGKYWNALGNTPGHYQHWTSKQFINFVAKKAKIIEVYKPLPWTIVHCQPNK